MSEYKFDGFNWMELAWCWGIKQNQDYPQSDDEEEAVAKAIVKYMHDALNTERETQMIGDLRRFIQALVDVDHNETERPLWIGLLEIEHNWTLVKFAEPLLRYMWT